MRSFTHKQTQEVSLCTFDRPLSAPHTHAYTDIHTHTEFNFETLFWQICDCNRSTAGQTCGCKSALLAIIFTAGFMDSDIMDFSVNYFQCLHQHHVSVDTTEFI